MTDKASSILRQRRCERCGHRFVTQEQLRARPGTKKLTELAAREIRRLAPDHTKAEIARRFGVSRTTVRDVLNRNTWNVVG